MLIIKKENLDNLKDELAKESKLVDLQQRDVLPFKKYFFLVEEEIFSFNKEDNKLSSKGGSAFDGKDQKEPEPFILFGLPLRATEALVQLDEIMKTPVPDFYYFQRRKASTVISIIEEDGPVPHLGVDLILEKINDKEYKVHILTEKGKNISKSKLFVKSDKKEIAGSAKKNKTMSELRKLLLDPELLKDAVEWSWKGFPEIWDDLGKRCIGCGICTYVCPLCHCFSIEDGCSLNGKTCSKTRKWSACTLPEFATVTGGHDFHPSIKERYYNWFYHKFVRAYKEYGKAQCVACGNCQRQCPARINIEEELLKIIEKYQEK